MSRIASKPNNIITVDLKSEGNLVTINATVDDPLIYLFKFDSSESDDCGRSEFPLDAKSQAMVQLESQVLYRGRLPIRPKLALQLRLLPSP